MFAHLVRHLDRRKFPILYLSVIDALGSMKGPEAIDALKATLQHGDWWAPLRTRRARAAAARALRTNGTPEALDALRDASTRGARGVRAAARAELSQAG
jgi:HEAT repeat protein